MTPTGEVFDPTSIPPGYQFRSAATSGARLAEYKMPLHERDRYAGRRKGQIRHPGEVCFGMPPKQADERGFLPSKCRALKEAGAVRDRDRGWEQLPDVPVHHASPRLRG